MTFRVSGHVWMSEQMFQQMPDDARAERELEYRLLTDPEFAEEWHRRVREYELLDDEEDA